MIYNCCSFLLNVWTEWVERPWADTSRWVGRCFVAAVLLVGIYMTRIKISPNRARPPHGSNPTVMMLFTMTLCCFSPSVTIHQTSEWSQVAVGISFVMCLSCAMGRNVHVLITFRAAHTVMKLFCPTQQQFKVVPATVLFLWMTFSPPIPNNNDLKLWFDDLLLGGAVGSTLQYWSVLGQIELLVTLYCVFFSLPILLQSIMTKFNFLTILLHVEWVTCLQNSRVPIKYVLIIKFNRLI